MARAAARATRRLTRDEKKARTRMQLIRAAERVFRRRSYAGATLDEIADVAHLTKGAIYSNFDGKADLAIAVLERRIDEPQLAIMSRVDDAPSQADRLRHSTKLLAEGIDAAWFQLELDCTAHAVRNPELLAKLRARDDAVRSRLAESLAQRGGTGSESLPWQQMATALMAVTNGIAFARLKDPATMPDDLIARLLASAYFSFEPRRTHQRPDDK